MIDLAAWPALILTAGLATRLRPLSYTRAKGSLPVGGVPLVARILRALAAAGVTRVVVNLHHRPETITRIVGDGSAFGLEARYSWEPAVLGSAGGPRRALPLLDANQFLVVNGDTLTDCDPRAVVSQHVETAALVTMAVVAGDPRYGGVEADDEGQVVRFIPAPHDLPGGEREPSRPSTHHFIGIQAVNASVFTDLPDDRPCETVKQLYPALLARQPGSIRVYRSSAEFFDVGTAEDYLHTAKTFAARERRPLDRGEHCTIDPTAVVRDTVLLDRVGVAAHAQLIDCVVGDDVEVPAGTRYERCALASGRDGLTVQPFQGPS